jgi:uncharacterized protein YceH (UPF0502 family)
MPLREDGPSLDMLREAARARVDATGLRQVAREIGVAHPSLHAFLHGSVPHGSTRLKLWTWYESEQNEMVRLRQEVAALRKRVAELERQLREVKK